VDENLKFCSSGTKRLQIHFGVQMKVWVPGKRLQVQVGEPVEVLVLSDLKNLARFMAVREVYLPKLGIWLAEEPCIERQVFEVLSEDLRGNYSWPSLLPPPKVCIILITWSQLEKEGKSQFHMYLYVWACEQLPTLDLTKTRK
jgi:hypothetical protein